MRRELQDFATLNPDYFGIASHAYSFLRRGELSIRKRLRLPPPGSPGWHLLQHAISKRSSLQCDLDLRAWFYSESLSPCGADLVVFPFVLMHYPRNISIGKCVTINSYTLIDAPAPIAIGNFALIGPGVVINSGNHNFRNPEVAIRYQGHTLEPIVVGDDVWIGANATIVAGITIGTGAVVGAGAVVTKPIPEGAIVAGVPARVIGRR